MTETEACIAINMIPKMGPVNYSYFGGEEAFGNMVETAKKNGGKTD